VDELEDPPTPSRQSHPSGQETAVGQEIRFIGQPNLALNRATNDLLPVAEFRHHPLVAGRYFYTLPPTLWDALLANLGEGSFDHDLIRMERILSAACGDHSSSVGFRDGELVLFAGLRPMPPLQLSDDDLRAIGMEPISIQNSLRLFSERDAEPLRRFRQGYVGWLTTNRQFLDEQDALLAAHAEVVRRLGTNFVELIRPSRTMLLETDAIPDPQRDEFNQACEAFFTRWRLLSLAGPYLPVPLQALMAGTFLSTAVPQLARAGGVFFLPDTMPIPSRDQLRGMLDDALHRGEKPDHLEDWFEIARAGNTARNHLDRFGRLFEVQHYWRVLYDRHAAALEGNIGRLEVAMSKFFELSPQTIHSDLIQIRRRLGEEWMDRTWPI
jgi:hypothetical protein